MGCVSSKLLREQASADDGSSNVITHQIPAKPNNSTASTTRYYYRHCVSLTSTSYGFMKVDTPIIATSITQHKKSKDGKGVGGIGTLAEMYGKLSSLEMNGVDRSKASNHGSDPNLNAGSPEYAISESIDVGDMMMGLEEAAPPPPPPLSPSSSPSPFQALDEASDGFASNRNISALAKPKRRQIEHQRLEKKKLRVVKEVSGLALECDDVDCDDKEGEVGKENSTPNVVKPAASKPTKGPPLLLRKESIASNRFLRYSDRGAMAGAPGSTPSKLHHAMAMMMKKYSSPCAESPSPSPSSRLASSKANLVADGSASPLFDPDLVASYEEALGMLSRQDWDSSSPRRHHRNDEDEDHRHHRSPIRGLDTRIYDPLECFEAKRPPGADNDKVVIYTTSLRGIRKTFENCDAARSILRGFDITMDERDVSMHLEYLNELKELMGKVVSVPRLFIKGRYIGGIEELVKLHEHGTLSELLEGLPKDINGGDACDGCGGARFLPCLRCNGSCKLRKDDNHVLRCPQCNENGLIQCPICT